jgi:integrase
MPFFRRRDGKPCRRNSLYAHFRVCIEMAGIHHEGRGKGPRLHDVRHTAAVHSMAAMADAGLDLYYCLPLLSKYLGHSSLGSTEKYVRLSEEYFPGVLNDANSIAPSIFPEVHHDR